MYELELKNVYMFEMDGTRIIIAGDGSMSEPRPRRRDLASSQQDIDPEVVMTLR